MQKYLICDTETTGLPVTYDAPFDDESNWPRILQLAWELCYENGETIEKHCDLVEPDGWRFPTGEFWKEHGFNEADNMMLGRPIKELMMELAIAMNCADVLIAHNLGYDKPIIECEMWRCKVFPKAVRRELIANNIQLKAGLRPEDVPLKKECTKLLSTPIVKLPGIRSDYAWPKLEVAYEFLMGKPFTGGHQADADVQACKEIYLCIKSL